MKNLSAFLKLKIETVEKKINKLNVVIEKRKADSKTKFPNQTILEVETMEDWITLAELYGQHKALKLVKKAL